MPDVRFGSQADICAATSHVRFAPNCDRESGLPQTVMSALPPKADICGAKADVRFGPIADIRQKEDRLAAVFRNCCVLVMRKSIASGHWQTEALFFEFFPYPFKLLVV